VGTIQDITERKKAEVLLAERTKFLDKVIESSALSTWISDEKGVAIRTNPACLEFFGATEDEVIGKYNLFKDEVRKLGKTLGLDDVLVWRQPFPGPGLAIRVIGEITKKRLDVLREVDAVLQDEIRGAGYYRKLWQSFAVLLPIKSVGIMGDGRTYENIVAIRAVTSKDAMTADWAKLPHKLLGKISNRIINEVRGVNRVVYDISSKPPSTIEWE